mmetsp:Transcript_17081/g.35085  ORF Transcript_17081/g.35085 Transcript_17081/m.35085 type:complete len:437 (-) Transcript_17081:1043-2353(-)
MVVVTQLTRLWEENVVDHVNHTVAGNNVRGDHQRMVSLVVPVAFLEGSEGFANRGDEIVAGVPAQGVDFPVAVQVHLEVQLARNVVLEDVSQFSRGVLQQVGDLFLAELFECLVGGSKEGVGARRVEDIVDVGFLEKVAQNVEIPQRAHEVGDGRQGFLEAASSFCNIARWFLVGTPVGILGETTVGVAVFVTPVIGFVQAVWVMDDRQSDLTPGPYFRTRFVVAVVAALGPAALVAAVFRRVRAIGLADDRKADLAFGLLLGARLGAVQAALRSTKPVARKIRRARAILLDLDRVCLLHVATIQKLPVLCGAAFSLQSFCDAMGIPRTGAGLFVEAAIEFHSIVGWTADSFQSELVAFWIRGTRAVMGGLRGGPAGRHVIGAALESHAIVRWATVSRELQSRTFRMSRTSGAAGEINGPPCRLVRRETGGLVRGM